VVAKRAAKLRDGLERRQNQLRDYRQAIAMCEPKEHDGGINLDEGDIAITPESALKSWRGT